ncbi:DUF1289 domain-containing protein [Methylibium petroleiphilum]|uniref:Fe-S protein n=1 Tax=Methylibium petroleiphilum (strain ATCC BAA-1232 / LMG 22953 / PM1) TaxID=420662 RepID=A2SL66_METPP|nr:DUF1289 domain-containing protein [Methylibium petroleiphilum]ABM96305.1 hypothetical protein Mpe_A3352 [Methylibium petroleiphilum PM1]
MSPTHGRPTTRDDDVTPVASPCIDICRIDAASGWCEGCYRTIDEIAAWSRLDDAGKRAVWLQLDVRRKPEESAG